MELWSLSPGIASEQRGAARIGPQQAQQDSDRCRLAGAVRPEEPVHFSLGHRQIESVQRGCGAERLSEALDVDSQRHGFQRTDAGRESVRLRLRDGYCR